MIQADHLQQLSASVWLWQAYHPALKADLFSTAVLTNGQLFVVDPIGLASAARAELKRVGSIAGILVTNANHFRAAQAWARREQVPVWGARSIGPACEGVTRAFPAGEKINPHVTTIDIEGAAPGETALHFTEDGGTVVIGDALINVEPYGFALLPAKYCSDQAEMRRSLRQLLDLSFKRLLFAHGYPLASSARERLQALLQ